MGLDVSQAAASLPSILSPSHCLARVSLTALPSPLPCVPEQRVQAKTRKNEEWLLPLRIPSFAFAVLHFLSDRRRPHHAPVPVSRSTHFRCVQSKCSRQRRRGRGARSHFPAFSEPVQAFRSHFLLVPHAQKTRIGRSRGQERRKQKAGGTGSQRQAGERVCNPSSCRSAGRGATVRETDLLLLPRVNETRSVDENSARTREHNEPGSGFPVSNPGFSFAAAAVVSRAWNRENRERNEALQD